MNTVEMNFVRRSSNSSFAIFKHPVSYQFFEMGEMYICITNHIALYN